MKRTPLKRNKQLARGKLMQRTDSFAASRHQREKAHHIGCIVCGLQSHETRIDPAHVLSRALGGCDAAMCVVPLCAKHHDQYDQGELDLLPHMTNGQYVEELQHALGHMNGNIIGLLRHISGRRWEPVDERRAA